MRIVVALKHVPLRVEVDPLTGAVLTSPRETGLSYADQAALEWALVLAERWSATVDAVTVASAAADVVLRDALAVGATRATRIDAPSDMASVSVARMIASVAAGADLVLCGDYSLDRGTGSVPAFLASVLGYDQALGLVSIAVREPGRLQVGRRLDGGRREVLDVAGPAVLSVEGSTARLRRASLKATMAASRGTIDLVAGASVAEPEALGTRRAYRPRARVLPPPTGATALERIRSITASVASGSGRTDPITLAPAAAAAAILDALRTWGYERPT
jgi:electron transfer flavoprotein beta subunit